MKCIIIDDEPLARQLLESYISRVEGLTLIRSCENAIEAFSFLQQRQVDLIFLTSRCRRSRVSICCVL